MARSLPQFQSTHPFQNIFDHFQIQKGQIFFSNKAPTLLLAKILAIDCFLKYFNRVNMTMVGVPWVIKITSIF